MLTDQTAGLALLDGWGLTLPAPDAPAEEKDEWIVILGASGNVGQYAVRVRPPSPTPPLQHPD